MWGVALVECKFKQVWLHDYLQLSYVFGCLQGLVPLLGVDMWEHAYYLQYNNVKADYLKEIWKIVNWKDVAARYSKAQ